MNFGKRGNDNCRQKSFSSKHWSLNFIGLNEEFYDDMYKKKYINVVLLTVVNLIKTFFFLFVCYKFYGFTKIKI